MRSFDPSSDSPRRYFSSPPWIFFPGCRSNDTLCFSGIFSSIAEQDICFRRCGLLRAPPHTTIQCLDKVISCMRETFASWDKSCWLYFHGTDEGLFVCVSSICECESELLRYEQAKCCADKQRVICAGGHAPLFVHEGHL